MRKLLVAVAVILGSSGLSVLAVNLEEIPCEPYPSLAGKMASMLSRKFDLFWPGAEGQVGVPDADGSRLATMYLQETEREDGRKVEPWRRQMGVARVRWEGDACEVLELSVERDWTAEITEHVVDRCLRYYAARAGVREDMDIALQLLRDGNEGWASSMIAAVRVDAGKNPGLANGPRRGMFYGQYRLACEREIEAGGLTFRSG